MRSYNIVVLGAGGVGKSALTIRFVNDEFMDQYDPTIEEEYRREFLAGDEYCHLEILDTAGAEQFSALNEVYIKSGRGFILTFSLTSEATLREVDKIRKQIELMRSGDRKIPLVVVGTKLDLINEREVTKETIQNLASRWGLPFYETSAKRNWHIHEVFADLVGQMKHLHTGGETPRRKPKKDNGKPCIIA